MSSNFQHHNCRSLVAMGHASWTTTISHTRNYKAHQNIWIVEKVCGSLSLSPRITFADVNKILQCYRALELLRLSHSVYSLEWGKREKWQLVSLKHLINAKNPMDWNKMTASAIWTGPMKLMMQTWIEKHRWNTVTKIVEDKTFLRMYFIHMIPSHSQKVRISDKW